MKLVSLCLLICVACTAGQKQEVADIAAQPIVVQNPDGTTTTTTVGDQASGIVGSVVSTVTDNPIVGVSAAAGIAALIAALSNKYKKTA